jgi:hypothetical protein
MTATVHASTTPPKLKRMPIAGWVLLGLPVLIVALKCFGPQAQWLRDTLTLETLTPHLQHTAQHILFLPLAAVAVVFFRLTLGLRVLGPFRAILLAWAFHYTGVLVGTLLLLVTVVALVLLRKPIVKLKLGYFGRITVMLSAVAVLMTLFLLTSTWTGATWLQQIAHLPVVVLCLISEAFVEVLRKEGYASAVWRMFTTIVLGMFIAMIAAWPLPGFIMIAHPELLLFQIGLIVVIARLCKWKLLDKWNPGLDDDEEPAAKKTLVGKSKPVVVEHPATTPGRPPSAVA